LIGYKIIIIIITIIVKKLLMWYKKWKKKLGINFSIKKIEWFAGHSKDLSFLFFIFYRYIRNRLHQKKKNNAKIRSWARPPRPWWRSVLNWCKDKEGKDFLPKKTFGHYQGHVFFFFWLVIIVRTTFFFFFFFFVSIIIEPLEP